jgi:esterase/lipase superfamily enzyme
MRPYLMISNRNREDDRLGSRLATMGFYTAPADADPGKLHTLAAWTKVTRQAFVAQLKAIGTECPIVPEAEHEDQKLLCLFVHGYNSDWEDTVNDYLLIKNGLMEGGGDMGQLVLYSWPSKGNVAGYLPDRESARDSAPDLSALLVELSDYLTVRQRIAARTDDPGKFCRMKVSVLAHSMGNYVMQEALVAASKQLNDPQLVSLINQFVMIAADVDNDLFERDQPSGSDGNLMANLCYRIAALYTGLDQVLGMSAGLKHFGTRRLGRSGLADPGNVWDNVFEFDVSDYIDTQDSAHSAVFESSPAIAVVRNILRGVDRNYIARDVAPYAQPAAPQPIPMPAAAPA